MNKEFLKEVEEKIDEVIIKMSKFVELLQIEYNDLNKRS